VCNIFGAIRTFLVRARWPNGEDDDRGYENPPKKCITFQRRRIIHDTPPHKKNVFPPAHAISVHTNIAQKCL